MTAVTSEEPKPLSESQKAALIKLLADEDLAVYHTVRSKILSYGQKSTSWMQPHTLSSDPIVRRRAQEIVQFLARQAADNSFLGFCLKQSEDLDVEEGSLLLAQTQYPDINVAAYKALFDSFAGDLRERIDFGAAAEGILAAMNQYLFEVKGFQGNEKNYYDPDNSYLNRVVDKRRGNPISLCLIYIFLGRRLKLPFAGIGMPGHFLCRFQTSTEEIFIDAFNQGKLLTKKDCIKYLQQTNHGFQDTYLAPITPRRILLRICSNLHQIYVKLGLLEETARFQHYIVALAK